MRAVVVQLTDRGVSHATERLRAGTVAFAGRAIRAFDDADGSKGAGWLAHVISDGASLVVDREALSDQERRHILAFDSLFEQRTGRQWGAS